MKLRLLLLPALLVASPAWADVALPPIISTHMVLQKSAKARVWGKADPGEAVAVTLDAATGKATAGPDGKWAVELNLSESKPGPFELVIQGKNRLAVADVVVGEVWVASGQSNMEFPIKGWGNVIDADKEIAASANPLLRQFSVTKAASFEPLDQCKGAWIVAGPEATAKFTAVGYYFGKKLQKELQAPVGIINSSWGGTPVEAWTRADALDSVPDLKAFREKEKQTYDGYPAAKAAYVSQMEQWLAATGRADQPADPSAFTGKSAEGWTELPMPVVQKTTKLPASGVIWVRTEVDIPKENAHQPVRLNLLKLEGFESVYWNGVLLKQATFKDLEGFNAYHAQEVPAQSVNEGQNTVAIRVHIPIQWNGFNFTLQQGGRTLPSAWQVKVESELPSLDAAKLAAAPQPPATRKPLHYRSTSLYNSMIAPLLPYTIRGAIWYQGESNTDRAWQYRVAFPLMIQDWRAQWKQGEFPFYFCQLANFFGKSAKPGEAPNFGKRKPRRCRCPTPARPS